MIRVWLRNITIGTHLTFGSVGAVSGMFGAVERDNQVGFSIPRRIIIYPCAFLAGFGVGMVSPWIYAIKKGADLVM